MPGPDTLQADRSWRSADLTAVLEGSWQPTLPTVGRRSDGVGLLYPGKVHSFAGESESGKSWLAAAVARDELLDGKDVVWIDFEDDEGGVVSRLLALQIPRDTIRERFHYIRPAEAIGTGQNLDDLREVVVAHRPTLAIVDGVTEAMTMHGLDPLSNKDIAAFGRMLPRKLAGAGLAVACLDHVTKSTDTRGRYAIGGVHKLNGLDGCAYLLESRVPFGIGTTGRSTIRIAKDRPGQLRRHGFPSAGGLFWFADLVLVSHDQDFAEVDVETPHEHDDTDFRPTYLMGQIAAAIDKHGPLSGKKLEALITGRAVNIRKALTLLQVDGYVSDETPHRLLKPWEDGDGDV